MRQLTIFWYEDNFDDLEEVIDELDAHCLANGYRLVIERSDSYPDHVADIGLSPFHAIEYFAVAFIDLNLKGGQKGTDLIKKLQEQNIPLEILLYSNNPIELFELTEGKNYVEGVFRFAELEGIADKMKSVIDLAIKREESAKARCEKCAVNKS